MKTNRLCVVSLMLLAGCSASMPNLPAGSAAYTTFPAASAGSQAYQISPLDVIAVNVFQEPDLTAKDIQVDSSGMILLPLIGTVQAAGKSTSQLGQEIAAKLGERYLDNPQVSVLVQTSTSQRVTVEGSVTEPGVYVINGRTTLVDALALAKGPSRVARLQEIVVFREVNGQRMGAVFDLARIRRGEAADPEILGRDRIVVGLSNVKAAWRDVLQTAPFLAIFRPF
jgi:polysaccharide export outer membrane protein